MGEQLSSTREMVAALPCAGSNLSSARNNRTPGSLGFAFASSSIFAAAKTGGEEDVDKLIRGGCPVNIRDSSGNSPAHVAAQAGNLVALQALVYQGTDITLVNKKGLTALQLAHAFHREECKDFLLARGADDSVLDSDPFMVECPKPPAPFYQYRVTADDISGNITPYGRPTYYSQ